MFSISQVLSILGVYYFMTICFRFSKFLSSLFQLFPYDLSNRYGKESYVLITGGSDGIGKGFAFEFAKRGFNLILLARNQKKLDSVSSEIKLKYPKTIIKLIVSDLLHSGNPLIFDEIFSQVKHLDISVFISNAGLDYCKEFLEAPSKTLHDLITVNCYPTVMLCHKLLALMSKRNKKSAVIIMSSIAGVLPTPLFTVYSATKHFLDCFTHAIKYEINNVDFLCVRPNFVSTNMTFNQPLNFETVSVEQCVNGALKDLGKRWESSGHWRHQLINNIYCIIPEYLLSKLWMNWLGKETLHHCEVGRENLKKIN